MLYDFLENDISIIERKAEAKEKPPKPALNLKKAQRALSLKKSLNLKTEK